jgi:sulfur-carrier protein adenylyltransferase/sulfurtransferase
MKEITVAELKTMIDQGADFQLIDVREQHEYDFANLGGELIPMGSIADNAEKISRDKKVIVHCRSGSRSAAVIKMLENKFGFDNLYNLKGGIIAWAKQVDSGMPQY